MSKTGEANQAFSTLLNSGVNPHLWAECAAAPLILSMFPLSDQQKDAVTLSAELLSELSTS